MPTSKTDQTQQINEKKAKDTLNEQDQQTENKPPPPETGALNPSSTSGMLKSLLPGMLPGLMVTDGTGRRTRSKSPVSVPASLICKVNSQYVRLQKLERIAKYVSEKRDIAPLNILEVWRKDVEEFEAFLVSRVRALEIASDTPSTPQKQTVLHLKLVKTYHSSSPGPTQNKHSSHKVTHSSRISQHPCIYCSEPHFIVTCPSFRRLTEQQRTFVMEKPLCFNCLGLHSAKNCKSQYRCKTCNGNHHTMIHVPRDTASKAARHSSNWLNSTIRKRRNHLVSTRSNST